MTAHDWAHDPSPRHKHRWRCRRCGGTVSLGGPGEVPDPWGHAYVGRGEWEQDCDDAAVRAVLDS